MNAIGADICVDCGRRVVPATVEPAAARSADERRQVLAERIRFVTDGHRCPGVDRPRLIGDARADLIVPLVADAIGDLDERDRRILRWLASDTPEVIAAVVDMITRPRTGTTGRMDVAS